MPPGTSLGGTAGRCWHTGLVQDKFGDPSAKGKHRPLPLICMLVVVMIRKVTELGNTPPRTHTGRVPASL